MRLAAIASKCTECGKPLPEPASTGRPRATCSDRCRKQASRKRHDGRQRAASYAARIDRPYAEAASGLAVLPDLASKPAETDEWSAGIWETFQEIMAGCQAGHPVMYESDTGDGTDTAELAELTRAWMTENPGSGLNFTREGRLALRYRLADSTRDVPETADANPGYRIDKNPPPGMCQVYLDREPKCRRHGERHYGGLDVCAHHYAAIMRMHGTEQ